MEPGESPDQTIIRELREELHLAPADIRYLGRQDHADGTRVHRHLIRLTDEEALGLRAGDEEQVFAFKAVDDIPDLPTTGRLKTYLTSILEPLNRLAAGKDISPADLRLTVDAGDRPA